MVNPVLYVAISKNDTIIMQESEIHKIQWYDFDKALDMLTFNNLKDVFGKAIKEL